MADSDEDDLQRASDELYNIDPEQFMARRAELTAAAKENGDKQLAKSITALRKPSKSAATLNRLAREDPDAISDLVDLGERLRTADRTVDPKEIRELNNARRTLLDTLTRRAFTIVGEKSPSSSLREEVVSTLTAALGDADVADQLAGGTLIKSASWEGFGFGTAPDLRLISSPPKERPPAAKPAAGKRLSKEDREQAREEAAAAEEERKAQAATEAEERKRAALKDAQQRVDDADEEVILATDEEKSRTERLRDLEEQVAQARKEVDAARVQLRRAEIRRGRAADALRKLGG